MMSTAPSSTVLRDLYAKMLLARIVDDRVWRLYAQGYIDFVTSSHGHEAAQVGSAICIEVGQDFTLPYYRDQGVVLTIGMTPYEVFRTCLHSQRLQQKGQPGSSKTAFQHWGYQKHNTITSPVPVATQLLHAAGIAFASKLRKAAVVTIAYCGDDATKEHDFAESLNFAARHGLPIVFICEQDCTPFLGPDSFATSLPPSCLPKSALPAGLAYQRIDGTDVTAVYMAMRQAMLTAREGHGPTFLELALARSQPTVLLPYSGDPSTMVQYAPPPSNAGKLFDPLVRCQHSLQEQGLWDDEWAVQLSTRMMTEVERALQDALRDTLQSK